MTQEYFDNYTRNFETVFVVYFWISFAVFRDMKPYSRLEILRLFIVNQQYISVDTTISWNIYLTSI